MTTKLTMPRYASIDNAVFGIKDADGTKIYSFNPIKGTATPLSHKIEEDVDYRISRDGKLIYWTDQKDVYAQHFGTPPGSSTKLPLSIDDAIRDGIGGITIAANEDTLVACVDTATGKSVVDVWVKDAKKNVDVWVKGVKKKPLTVHGDAAVVNLDFTGRYATIGVYDGSVRTYGMKTVHVVDVINGESLNTFSNADASLDITPCGLMWRCDADGNNETLSLIAVNDMMGGGTALDLYSDARIDRSTPSTCRLLLEDHGINGDIVAACWGPVGSEKVFFLVSDRDSGGAYELYSISVKGDVFGLPTMVSREGESVLHGMPDVSCGVRLTYASTPLVIESIDGEVLFDASHLV